MMPLWWKIWLHQVRSLLKENYFTRTYKICCILPDWIPRPPSLFVHYLWSERVRAIWWRGGSHRRQAKKLFGVPCTGWSTTIQKFFGFRNNIEISISCMGLGWLSSFTRGEWMRWVSFISPAFTNIARCWPCSLRCQSRLSFRIFWRKGKPGNA